MPLPREVAWRSRQAEARSWLATPARSSRVSGANGGVELVALSSCRVRTTLKPRAVSSDRRRKARARVTSFSTMESEMREPLSAPPCAGSMTMVSGWKGSGGKLVSALYRRSAEVFGFGAGVVGEFAEVVVAGVDVAGAVEVGGA